MISREQVLTYLQGKQESNGGYTGNDIAQLAEFLNITPRGLKREYKFSENPIQVKKEFYDEIQMKRDLLYLG